MTNRLALVVAIVLGVLSILLINRFVEKVKTQYEQQVQPIAVPVAARDIRAGESLQKADVIIKEFPHAVLDGLSTSYFKDPDQVINIGKTVVEIKQGQILQQYHFRQQTLSKKNLRVDRNFRALTVLVNAQTGICGMLRPGHLVDIITTEDYVLGGIVGLGAATQKLKITRTLCKQVPILAIDYNTDSQSTQIDYTNLTLQLSSENVNRLCHVIDNGWPYHFVLVDDTAQPSPGANVVIPESMFNESKDEYEAKRGK